MLACVSVTLFATLYLLTQPQVRNSFSLKGAETDGRWGGEIKTEMRKGEIERGGSGEME